jgi:hypothetical protein
MVSE